MLGQTRYVCTKIKELIMKQIKLLLILCVLILLASCRTTESTNSLNITSESKDISSGKEFFNSQPILKDNVNLSMSVFKGVTSIFSEDVINSAFKHIPCIPIGFINIRYNNPIANCSNCTKYCFI